MKRKILDFSVMKEGISQNNVLEMAELIAFMELRFQIGYLGSRAQKMLRKQKRVKLTQSSTLNSYSNFWQQFFAVDLRFSLCYNVKTKAINWTKLKI